MKIDCQKIIAKISKENSWEEKLKCIDELFPWERLIDVSDLPKLQKLIECRNVIATHCHKKVLRRILLVDGDSKENSYALLEQSTIQTFGEIIESRDELTGEHVRRTSYYVEIIAKELHKNPEFSHLLTKKYIARLAMVAPLHDIGKIAISDTILNKKGKLAPQEFEIMKTHTTAGKKMIDSVLKSEGKRQRKNLILASEIAYTHHEWWNGKGYPRGIQGTEIPLSGRIMAVADVFDALTSKRSYKVAFPVSQAFQIIKEGSGTHFDPAVVKAFFDARPRIEAYINGERPSKKKSVAIDNIIDICQKQ